MNYVKRRRERDNREEVVSVRMTKAEKAEFEALAQSLDVSLGAFMRNSAKEISRQRKGDK